ncbi:ABC transporter permease [Halosimplex aquaticum]|uniref:ABC transporter permease n=1 Tax=Halosimplex aquaticum TaxID=3026162 RepID=A0ABD5Y753_9EURY|nr:ABC transporter permease [Halosimplex aquaticum]
MKPSEDRRDGTPETDGGTEDASPFEILMQSSDDGTQTTRKSRLKGAFVQYVYGPLSIMAHDWRAVVGLSIVLFYLGVGVLGPTLVEPTSTNDGGRFVKPLQTWAHPLGTDNLGRDLLALHVYATKPILQMMAAGGLFTVSMGTLFGTVSGYKGGTVDVVLSTITDIFINIPGLPLVIVLAAIIQPENPYVLGLLLTVAAWAGLARAIRSQVLSIRTEAFTEASRTIGVPQQKIILRDVLPHLLPYITVNLVQAMRNVLFGAVGLYFIGVLPITDPNWGTILNTAYSNNAHLRPNVIHWLLIPTAVIVVLSIGMILLSQSLDRVFNPRVRAKHIQQLDESPPEEGAEDVENTDSWV